MTTIADLAREFNAQPYEVAAFADLGDVRDSFELDADTEAAIREAWASVTPLPGEISVSEQNRAEDHLLDDVAEIVDRAGYDY
jgi:hypothetical protein